MEQEKPRISKFAQARRNAFYAATGALLAWQAGDTTSMFTGGSLSSVLWLGSIGTGIRAVMATASGIRERIQANNSA